MQMVTPTPLSIRTGIAILFLAGLLAQPAEGQSVLFDGSIPPALIDDIGFSDPHAGGQRLAEDFQLTSASIANEVTLLGGYYPADSPLSDSFTFTIFGDDAGRPDPSEIIAVVQPDNVTRTDTGVDIFGIDLYSYSATFSGVPLTAGIPYWLMVVNDTSNDPNDDWVWGGRHEGGVFGISRDGGVTWPETPVGAFSFQILGEIAGATGACCFPDESCEVLTRSECEDQQGSYLGDGVPCEPNPCEVTSTEETTWGGVKLRYR